MIEVHVARESSWISGRVILEPDPVQFEIGVASPPEALERGPAGTLGENAAIPGAVREPLAQMTDLDPIEPDRMLSVEVGRGIVQLDHVLHARPLTAGRADVGI